MTILALYNGLLPSNWNNLCYSNSFYITHENTNKDLTFTFTHVSIHEDESIVNERDSQVLTAESKRVLDLVKKR